MGIDSLLQQNMQNSGLAGTDRLARNAMFPQSQMDKTQYSVSSQMPTGAQTLKADYDTPTDAYTGLQAPGFTAGGITTLKYDEGGETPAPWDPTSGQVKLQQLNPQDLSVAKTADYTIPKDDIQTFIPDTDTETGLPLGSGSYILNSGSKMRVDNTGTVIDATPARDEYTLNKDGYYQPTGSGLTWDGSSGMLTKKIGGVDVQVPGMYTKGGYQDEQGGLRLDQYGTPIPLPPAQYDSGAGKSGLSDAAPFIAAAAMMAATGMPTGFEGMVPASQTVMGGLGGLGAAAGTTPAWMTAAGKGAAVGAAMGGGSAALTGGNIGQGIIRGGITGAIGGGAGSAMGGGLMGNMAGGALAGGAGSALRGGNIAQGAGMGAAGGALSSGISSLDAPDAVKYGLNMFGKPLAMSQIGNAMGGGQSPQGGIPGSTPNTGGYGISTPSGPYNAFNPGVNTGAGVTGLTGLGANTPQGTNPFAAQYAVPNIQLSKLSDFDGYAGGGMTHGDGIASLGSYSDGGHLLKGPGDGMSDDIPAKIGNAQPARLADGEFVVPADVVSHLGNGSTDAGAKQLYKMMDKIRHARTGNKKQGKQINPDKYLP